MTIVRPWMRASLLALGVAGCGCGGPATTGPAAPPPPRPRTSAVWLGAEGIDAAEARRLQQVGVDQLVVPRGEILLRGATPVLRLEPAPVVEGPIPVAIALRLRAGADPVTDESAATVWKALAAELSDGPPAALILDLPELPEGIDELLAGLARESLVPVIPVLTIAQLDSAPAQRVAAQAETCLVPVAGSPGGWLRGVDDRQGETLVDRLASIRDRGVRVRAGIALHSRSIPELGVWGDDLGPLTERGVAEVSTTSQLDRTFVLSQALSWSGRSWPAKSSIALGWVDAARLHQALTEVGRLVLPEAGGWDLVPLPPRDGGLGMSRDALLGYLAGAGPGPEVRVEPDRSGRTLTVRLASPGPFGSAVSGIGTWLEVAIDGGTLVAEGRGSFDRIILGTTRDGRWQPMDSGRVDAVRFLETHLAPEERLETGPIRLPTAGSVATIRWRVLLSDGSELTGETRSPR